MAGGTKDRLDRLEEQVARIQGAVCRLDDAVGVDPEEAEPVPLCQRYEDLLGRVLELSHALELLTPEVHSLSGEVNLLRSSAPVYPCAREVGPCVKVPEPSPFDGARSAKTLENFLWDVDQYFKAAKVLETE